jgi:hypothetical protein
MMRPTAPDPDEPAAGAGHDFVRPFIMTGGRTEAGHKLRLETLVQRGPGPVPAHVPSEQRALLDYSEHPISVAELAAGLALVVGVVAVLIDDLLQEGLLELYETDPDDLELEMLTRMADKIRSL